MGTPEPSPDWPADAVSGAEQACARSLSQGAAATPPPQRREVGVAAESCQRDRAHEGWSEGMNEEKGLVLGEEARGKVESDAGAAGHKAVEDAAVAWVVELERGIGRRRRTFATRARRKTSRVSRGSSRSAVGKPSARGEFLWLETKQVDAASRTRTSTPTRCERAPGRSEPVHRPGPRWERLSALLARAKERRYSEVPLPVGIYDSTPRLSKG